MLLLWCLSMIQAFSISFSVKELFHLFIVLKQAIVSVSGRVSPHSFEMFSISPLQAYLFRCWFSNDSVITFSEGCFPSSLVVEVGIFSSICYSNDLSSILSSGGIVMLHSSTHHPIFVKDHVLSFAYPFNWSVVSSFQVLFILPSLASLFNRSAIRI